MNTFYGTAAQMPENEPEGIGSVTVLIQRGLDYLVQGKNAEGITLLIQAHSQLANGLSEILSVLEQTINACVRYAQAEEALLQASKDYVKAEIERERHLSILAATLARDSHKDDIPLTSHPEYQYVMCEREQADYTAAPIASTNKQGSGLPALSISCFGQFIVQREGSALALCRSRNGQTILRYLVAQAGYRATSDALIDALWANEEPAVARRRLQIASSALRSALNHGYACEPGGGYILCKNQVYQINPSVTLQTDVDEFLRLYQQGLQASYEQMIICYEEACQLYRGPFLVEDLYADWSMRPREKLGQTYLTMCDVLSKYCLEAGRYEDAARWARAMLDENRCDEGAHRHLMISYTAQGRRNDALRQYHYCEQVLLEELNVTPMLETVQVYQSILAGHFLPR
ncbi:MAG TPA: bacterial transcriptional activator domain-containing protein [Ktedonobacteraceae bacterium]|nr:bacterial transcriptional activator domain-containing protein [Ktedonobacteraceae bacterium]